MFDFSWLLGLWLCQALIYHTAYYKFYWITIVEHSIASLTCQNDYLDHSFLNVFCSNSELLTVLHCKHCVCKHNVYTCLCVLWTVKLSCNGRLILSTRFVMSHCAASLLLSAYFSESREKTAAYGPLRFSDHLLWVGSMWQLTSALSCVPKASLRKTHFSYIFIFILKNK